MFHLYPRTEGKNTLPHGAAGDGLKGFPLLILFIAWGILLPIVAGLGLIGNILTMIVLWRKEMRSTTILFLKALVISDTGILIGGVLTLTIIIYADYFGGQALIYFKEHVYPNIYSPCFYAMMTLEQFNVLITVSVATERYISICHPFLAETFITKEKNKIVIITIATISMLFNLPHFFAFEVVECKDTNSTDVSLDSNSTSSNTNSSNVTVFPISSVTPKSQFEFDNLSTPVSAMNNKPCYTNAMTPFGKSWYYDKFQPVLYTVIIQAIPFLTLFILNSLLIKELMVMQMRHAGTNVNDDDEADLSLALVLIIIVYILSKTPAIISQFKVNSTQLEHHEFLAASNLLLITNSSVNFLIYTAFGRKFRQVLLRVFRRLYKRKGNQETSVPEKTNTDFEMSNVVENDMVQNDKNSDGQKTESKLSDNTNDTTRKQPESEKPLNDMADVNEVS